MITSVLGPHRHNLANVLTSSGRHEEATEQRELAARLLPSSHELSEAAMAERTLFEARASGEAAEDGLLSNASTPPAAPYATTTNERLAQRPHGWEKDRCA